MVTLGRSTKETGRYYNWGSVHMTVTRTFSDEIGDLDNLYHEGSEGYIYTTDSLIAIHKLHSQAPPDRGKKQTSIDNYETYGISYQLDTNALKFFIQLADR